MPTQKTQAIIIRSHPLGEVHKIIRFYTIEFGKVSAVAHGSRRLKSRSAAALNSSTTVTLYSLNTRIKTSIGSMTLT